MLPSHRSCVSPCLPEEYWLAFISHLFSADIKPDLHSHAQEIAKVEHGHFLMDTLTPVPLSAVSQSKCLEDSESKPDTEQSAYE